MSWQSIVWPWVWLCWLLLCLIKDTLGSPLTSQSKDIIFCFLFSGPNQDCCWLPDSRQGVMLTEWLVANLYNNQQADAVHSKQWVFGRSWWKKQPDNVGLYLDPPKKPLNMALMQFHFIQNQWGVKLKFFPFLSSAAWILGDSGRVIKKGGVLECFNSSVLDVVKWTIIIPRQINSRLRSVLAVVIWVALSFSVIHVWSSFIHLLCSLWFWSITKWLSQESWAATVWRKIFKYPPPQQWTSSVCFLPPLTTVSSHWNHLELLLLTVSRLPRSLPALSSPSKQKQIELSWRQMVGVVTSVCVCFP